MPSLSPDQRHHRQALWEAVLTGNFEAAQRHVKAGTPVEMMRGTKSLLGRALEQPDERLAVLLIEAGATPQSKAHNRSALELAIDRHRNEAIRAMIKQGIDFTAAVSPWSAKTPAGVAASSGNGVALRLFAEAGAPMTGARAENGWGPESSVVDEWLGRLRHSTKHALPADYWSMLGELLGYPSTQPMRFSASSRLGQALSGKQPHDGEKALKVFQSSSWWQSDFIHNLSATLIRNGNIDEGMRLIEDHGHVVLEGPDTPYQASALGALLTKTAQEHGPRRLKKLLQQVDTLLAQGSNPNAMVRSLPLWVWACTVKGMPRAALAKLLSAGGNPKDPYTQAHLANLTAQETAWENAPWFHYVAHHGTEAAIEAMFSAYPDLLSLEDASGLKPIHACLLPRTYVPGMKSKPTWLPCLEAFWQVGSRWNETTSRGSNLFHIIALAAQYEVQPVDLGDTLLTLVRRCPGMLLEANDEGETGWEALQKQPSVVANPSSQRFCANAIWKAPGLRKRNQPQLAIAFDRLGALNGVG